MNNILLLWREFSGMDTPSISTCFADKPYCNQQKIIKYLEDGAVRLPSAGVGVDIFTQKNIMTQHAIMTDGEFVWDSMLPYYVKTYNMRLPEEFEKKVLCQP